LRINASHFKVSPHNCLDFFILVFGNHGFKHYQGLENEAKNRTP